MITISIIIPIYNAEKYLKRCLDSILAQTYPHWECILVDDGNKDNSGAICDEYAGKDNRFIVIHQPNGGVSVARQTGIDAATGEYSIHADPDDWIDPDMLETLLAQAQENNADLVICDYWKEENGGQFYVSQNPGEDLSSSALLKKMLLQQLHGSCCNKLLKRACYSQIKYNPTTMSCFEDELFNIRVLAAHSNMRIVYVPRAFYHYVIHSVSLSHGVTERMLYSRCKEIEEVERILPSEPYNNFFVLKVAALFIAFELKKYNLLATLYPEIRKRAIDNGRPYSWLRPHACTLSIALRGYPRLADCIFRFHLKTIELKETFDYVFRNRKRK